MKDGELVKEDYRWSVYCSACETTHDFENHADWSATCSCGCRCPQAEKLERKLKG